MIGEAWRGPGTRHRLGLALALRREVRVLRELVELFEKLFSAIFLPQRRHLLEVGPQLAVLLVFADVGRDHHHDGQAVYEDDGDHVVQSADVVVLVLPGILYHPDPSLVFVLLDPDL